MSVQTQIDSIGERMDKGFEEIKSLLGRYEERLRGIETREAGCAPIVNSRLDAAWRRLDEHSLQIKSLADDVREISNSALLLTTVSKWVLGIVTALVISFAVAILTGKIEILYK